MVTQYRELCTRFRFSAEEICLILWFFNNNKFIVHLWICAVGQQSIKNKLIWLSEKCEHPGSISCCLSFSWWWRSSLRRWWMAWFRPWSPDFLPLTSATPHSSECKPSISPASLCNWNEISSPASQQFFYSFLPQILSIILFDGTALLRTWRPINFLPLFISAAFTFLSCSSPASQGCFTSPHFLWSTSGISPEACAVSFCGELKWSVL